MIMTKDEHAKLMIKLGNFSIPYRMALTLYGEASGEPFDAKIAIAHVMKWREVNNIAWDDIADPMQFSCWNLDDPNLERIRNIKPFDEAWEKCCDAAYGVYYDQYPDPTGGSTHYYNPKLMEILYNKAQPPWAEYMQYCTVIGNHIFVRDLSQRPIRT
jgi:spore germination cell wall hydrolase CwlJ-like protein